MKELGAKVLLLLTKRFELIENFFQDSIEGSPTSGVTERAPTGVRRRSWRDRRHFIQTIRRSFQISDAMAKGKSKRGKRRPFTQLLTANMSILRLEAPYQVRVTHFH